MTKEEKEEIEGIEEKEKKEKAEKDQKLQEKIGHNIREYRKLKKLIQSELAHKAGVSTQLISAYEKGVNNQSIINVKAIADALGVTVNDLLEEDEKTLQVRNMETDPLLAFVTAMRVLRFKVSLTDDNKIILEPAEQSIDYSKYHLIEFITKYISINEKFNESDEQYKLVKYSKIDELISNYSFLPSLPDYPKD